MVTSRDGVRAMFIAWCITGIAAGAALTSCKRGAGPAPSTRESPAPGPSTQPSRGRPEPIAPSQPTQSASPFAWVPSDTVTLFQAPGAGVPLLDIVRSHEGRPACVNAIFAAVQHSLQLQRDPKEPMAVIVFGALDRDRTEACVVAYFAAIGIELTVKRTGWTTSFSSSGGSGVVAFTKHRVVYAETLDQLHAVVSPRFRLGTRSPLTPLVARLDRSRYGLATTSDPLRRFTGVEAIGLVAQAAPSSRSALDLRIVYRDGADAERSLAALQRLLARSDLPPGAAVALRKTRLRRQENAIRIDLSPIMKDHATLEQVTSLFVPKSP